jgi:hypothetical protein
MKEINNVYDLNLNHSIKDLIYLQDLIYAIKNVANKNCEWKSLTAIYSEERRIQTTESLFSHEIYHQFRKIIGLLNGERDCVISGNLHKYIKSTIEEDSDFANRYKNLRLDTNVYKSFVSGDFDLLAYNLKDLKPDWKKGIYPDLVLHEGQDSERLQKLLIEIKTTIKLEEERIIEDLDKLLSFSNYYNFDFGVFIIVNNESLEFYNKLKTLYSYQKAQENQLLFKKIILLCYNKEILTGGVFYDLLNEDVINW